MKQPLKNIIILMIFLFSALIITIILSTYYRNKEKKQSFYFEINNVKVSPAGRCDFYDKNNKKLKINSYTFFERYEVKEGDIIVKEANSTTLTVYRKDSAGNKTVFFNLQPDGSAPYVRYGGSVER